MSHLTLYVGFMGCRRCLREVTAMLRDVPGVETVVADAARSTVRLGGTMAATEVLGAFVGSTYVPRLLDGAPPTPTPPPGRGWDPAVGQDDCQ